MFDKSIQVKFVIFSIFVSILLTAGCAVKAAKNAPGEKNALKNSASDSLKTNGAETSKGAKISITPNSPADTVRAFYQKLRENRIREAMFLTNLRPAIESLTEAELKDFQVDFAAIASQIPAEIEINGEIISNDQATVTAKLPDNDTDKLELQQIELRKENGVWIILTVDAETEKLIKKEGKNYFYALRIETHEKEAKAMLGSISKAQMVYALQNGGAFADFKTLIEQGLLGEDVLSSESTGYNYSMQISGDKKRYYVNATPAVYGKTGKISFLMDYDGKGKIRFDEKEKGGQPLKK